MHEICLYGCAGLFLLWLVLYLAPILGQMVSDKECKLREELEDEKQ